MKQKIAIIYMIMTLQLFGCAAVLSALPTVIAAVMDAFVILDAIDDFSDRYFKVHPDPGAQSKIDNAITKARASLNIALRTTQGAQDLSDQDIERAFASFRVAYQELLVLVGPIGIKSTSSGDNALSASSNQLVVPEPIALGLRGK
jgi:hypothetical protein